MLACGVGLGLDPKVRWLCLYPVVASIAMMTEYVPQVAVAAMSRTSLSNAWIRAYNAIGNEMIHS